MRDAAGELADRIHLLRLAQLLLQLVAFGDIGERECHAFDLAAIEHGGRIETDIGQRTILAPSLHPDVTQSLARQRARKKFVELGFVIRRHQKIGLADRFVGAVSENLLSGPAPDHYGAVGRETDDRNRRRIDDRGQHFIRGALGALETLLFGHVAADEEVASLGLRPHAGPRQRDRVAVLVNIAGVEIADLAAAPRQTHFVAGGFKIVRMNEIDADMADHLLRPIIQDGLGARAHTQETALPVRHQDQIQRSVEQSRVLLDFMLERVLARVGPQPASADRGKSRDQQSECQQRGNTSHGIVMPVPEARDACQQGSRPNPRQQEERALRRPQRRSIDRYDRVACSCMGAFPTAL